MSLSCWILHFKIESPDIRPISKVCTSRNDLHTPRHTILHEFHGSFVRLWLIFIDMSIKMYELFALIRRSIITSRKRQQQWAVWNYINKWKTCKIDAHIHNAFGRHSLPISIWATHFNRKCLNFIFLNVWQNGLFKWHHKNKMFMTHVYNAFEFTARILDYSKPDLHGVDTKEMVNFVHESIFRMASIQINSQLIMINSGHLDRNCC